MLEDTSREERVSVSAMLDEIRDSGKLPPQVLEDPPGFLLSLHEAWKQNGGRIGGKPRNSDRQLAELLQHSGTPVASLRPKLRGRTQLKLEEARILIQLFLSHWSYSESDFALPPNKTNSGYSPLFGENDINIICELFIKALMDISIDQRKIVLRSRVGSMPGRDNISIIVEEYRNSDALVTVSGQHIVLVADPKQALIRFRDLMNSLWDVDKKDGKQRLLIWIVNLGRLSFADESSRLQFINVEALVTRLKALRRFDDTDADERWRWLEERSIVIVRNLRMSEIDNLYGNHGLETLPTFDELPWMTAEHISLSAIPATWASTEELRILYGRNLEHLDMRTYTVFYRKCGWPDGQSNSQDIKYFAYALFDNDYHGIIDSPSIRGLELPSPDPNYDEAFRAVYAVAALRLGLRKSLESDVAIDASKALAQLRHLGFGVLKLDEFLKI